MFPFALTGRPYDPARLTHSSVITRIRCAGLEYDLAISEDKFNFIRRNHASHLSPQKRIRHHTLSL